jgi:hypothetical protein
MRVNFSLHIVHELLLLIASNVLEH